LAEWTPRKSRRRPRRRGRIPEINIGETVADLENPVALPLLHIEEPPIKMTVMVNDSPFAGKEGQFCTSRQIRARLYKELETTPR